MPPATFIAAAAATLPTDLGTGHTFVTVLTPTTVKAGDSLLIVIAGNVTATCDVDVARLPAGWSVIGRFTTGGGRIFNIVRRIATDTEPPSHAIPTTGVGAAIAGALLVYRGLDTGAALVAGGANDVVANTNYVCTSLTLTTYSDLYLGIATSISHTFTPPFGTTERFDAAGTIELEIFEYLKEATGATGALVATVGAVDSGIAAGVLLKTATTLPAAAIVPDIPGAIGLVRVGV